MKKRTVLTWGLVTALALPVGALASKGSDDSKSGSSSSGSGSGKSGSDDTKVDDKGGSSSTASSSSSNSGSGAATSTSTNSTSTNSSDDTNISDDKGVDITPDDHGVDTTADDHGNDSSTNSNSNNNSNSDNGGNTQSSFVKVEVPLAPTSAAAAISAHGHVDIRVEGSKQRIEVEVEADLADGTVVNISLNGAPAGTATFHLGEAEFEFETGGTSTLPGGILPSDVTSASVADSGGTVLLSATFGAVGTGTPVTPPPSSTLVSKKINLTATADAPNGSKAVSELRIRSGNSRYKVQVEANVADGTVYNVSANGIQIGSITMKLHRGELELEHNAVLPAGLSSLADITTVTVSNTGGTALFNGTF